MNEYDEQAMIQKKTEDLLNRIAENNKEQDKIVFRTHSIAPKITKDSSEITFIN